MRGLRALVSVRPAQRLRWVTDIGQQLAARRDRAAHVVSLDSGKSLSEAYTEMSGTVRYFEYSDRWPTSWRARYVLGDGYVDYQIPVPTGCPHSHPLELPRDGVRPR